MYSTLKNFDGNPDENQKKKKGKEDVCKKLDMIRKRERERDEWMDAWMGDMLALARPERGSEGGSKRGGREIMYVYKHKAGSFFGYT